MKPCRDSTCRSSMALACCFSRHSWAAWMSTGRGCLGSCDWRLDASFRHWSACGGWQRAEGRGQLAATCSSGGGGAVRAHLVGVHRQQGLVEVDGLQLLLHQLVLDALGVGQLHLLLGVKHVLVLWLEEFGSSSDERVLQEQLNSVWGLVVLSSGRHQPRIRNNKQMNKYKTSILFSVWGFLQLKQILFSARLFKSFS